MVSVITTKELQKNENMGNRHRHFRFLDINLTETISFSYLGTDPGFLKGGWLISSNMPANYLCAPRRQNGQDCVLPPLLVKFRLDSLNNRSASWHSTTELLYVQTKIASSLCARFSKGGWLATQSTPSGSALLVYSDL